MKKLVLICMLSLIAPIHCQKNTSQTFWDEQVFLPLPGHGRPISQLMATVSCFTASAALAKMLDDENRSRRTEPFSNIISIKGALLTAFLIGGLTFYWKFIISLSINLINLTTLQLQTIWIILSKDLMKLGIEEKAAAQLAHFLILNRETLGAKQIVVNRLKEFLLDEETSNYIIKKFFDDELNSYPKPVFSHLKPQSIKNLMLLYNMYSYEAEYIVDQYYALINKKALSPIAGKVMQLKLQKKFPNHPALELFLSKI